MEYTQVHDVQVLRAPLSGWLLAWRRERGQGYWSNAGNWDSRSTKPTPYPDEDPRWLEDIRWFDVGVPPDYTNTTKAQLVQQLDTANTRTAKGWGVCGIARPSASISVQLEEAKQDFAESIAWLGPLWICEWVEPPQTVTVTIDGQVRLHTPPFPFIDEEWRRRARAQNAGDSTTTQT